MRKTNLSIMVLLGLLTALPAHAKTLEISGQMSWGGFVEPPLITQTPSNIYFDVHQIWNFEGGLEGAYDEFAVAKINVRSQKGIAHPTGTYTGSIDGQSGTMQFEFVGQIEAVDLQNNAFTAHFEALMNEGTEGLEGWVCFIRGDAVLFQSGTYSGFCVVPND